MRLFMQKHFQQLHAREHHKKLSHTRKVMRASRTRDGDEYFLHGMSRLQHRYQQAATKYFESEKAHRYRDAALSAGAGFKANKRLGESGHTLKMLLHR